MTYLAMYLALYLVFGLGLWCGLALKDLPEGKLSVKIVAFLSVVIAWPIVGPWARWWA